jgi:hypothetical protein
MPGGSEVRLLTQEEVAKVLRRSVRSVARLRNSGQLAWLPGSPVMIPETELAAYLDRKMVKREVAEPPPAPAAPKWTPEDRAAKMIDDLRRSGQLAGVAELVRRTRGKA